MRKYILSMIFLASFMTALAQNGDSPNAKLVRTFYKGDFLHANNEAALDIKEYSTVLGDKVAVRICSREPMPLALAIASGRPFLLASTLSGYGYSPNDILFLRYSKCPNFDPKIAITEYWSIPKGSKLPPAIEVLKSTQVKPEEYITQGDNKEAAFNDNLLKLARNLQQIQNSYGIVAGYYHKKPSYKLKQKLQKAQFFLSKQGIPSDRYFVRLLPWTGLIDAQDPEPIYPALISITIIKE